MSFSDERAEVELKGWNHWCIASPWQEERAKRLAAEEATEYQRGRDLNIITGSATPLKPPTMAAMAPPPAAAAAPPAAAAEERPHGKGIALDQ